jgi:hypothetical protein
LLKSCSHRISLDNSVKDGDDGDGCAGGANVTFAVRDTVNPDNAGVILPVCVTVKSDSTGVKF